MDIDTLRATLGSKAARIERIGGQVLIQGDCLEVMPLLGKVDAVVTDPPYHGVKKDGWDNQWATDQDFLDWASLICDGIHAKTSKTASLYWFCSPQMAGRIESVISRKFRVLNSLVWDKSGGRKGVGGTGIDVTALRCFWSASTERIVFAERAEGDNEAREMAGYDAKCEAAKATIFGDYMRSEFLRAGVKNKQVAALFPSKTGGTTGCVSNWLLGLNIPTPQQYQTIRKFLNQTGGEYMRREYEDLRREYEDLRREYEDLRREYEDLRRPFNLNSSVEWGDIWKFPIERKQSHPTQKPESLICHIIRTSSKPATTILDPFMGSGTTLVACQKLGRQGIGIELDPDYFAIACKRVDEATRQPDLFVAPTPAAPTQDGFDL